MRGRHTYFLLRDRAAVVREAIKYTVPGIRYAEFARVVVSEELQMKIDDETLRGNLGAKDTEELIELRDAGTLTPEADRIVSEILDSRGYSHPEPQVAFSQGIDTQHSRIFQYLNEHFRGERPLWSAFWLCGVAGFLITLAIALLLLRIRLEFTGPLIKSITSIAQIVLWVAYLTEASASIWRCAYNVRWRAWGHLARGLFIVLAMVLVGAVLLPLFR